MTGDVRPRVGSYREMAVPADLEEVCGLAWVHEPAPGSTHRLLPDSGLSLGFRCLRDAAGRIVDGQVVLVGPITRPFMLRTPQGYRMTAIRLEPEWVLPLFGLHPAEHPDINRNLAETLPRLADTLLARLAAQTSPEAEARVLIGAVRQRLATARPCLLPQRALSVLRRSHGTLSVDAVARACGSSVRHLRRVVRNETGVALRAYARNVRFLRAVALADHTSRPKWAAIAAQAGYYDQSHLIRDARAMAHATPREIHRERRSEA